MILKILKIWLKKIFFNYKRNERVERLIKESRVRAAELAVFKETEVIRLKARLART